MTPRQPQMEISITNVQQKAQVIVTTDTPNSTVCLWDSGNEYHVVTADKNGKATFLVEPSVGEVSVTVSGANLNSTSKKVSIPAS